MKHILVLVILLSVATPCFAVPDSIQKGKPTFVVYDTSYNIALRKKLEDDYHKKYTKIVNENLYIDTSPLGAYEKEVVIPYIQQQKSIKETIINN